MANNSTRVYGSLNFSVLLKLAKEGHASFRKVDTKNGPQIFFDYTMWLNEEPNNFGHHASFQIAFPKDMVEKAKQLQQPLDKIYFGNGIKAAGGSTGEPLTSGDSSVADVNDDDLPF